jgi:hypothetical protein
MAQGIEVGCVGGFRIMGSIPLGEEQGIVVGGIVEMVVYELSHENADSCRSRCHCGGLSLRKEIENLEPVWKMPLPLPPGHGV